MSEPTGVSILGATGSIGASALKVIRMHPDHFKVVGLTAWRQSNALTALVREFREALGASAQLSFASACLASAGVHQVVWENEETLGLKYALAARKGLRGVGMWLASARWPDQAPASQAGVKAMYDSVVQNFL